MEQAIAFIPDRRGRSIAYATNGRGRPLLCDTGMIGHLEVQWAFPPYRAFFETLGQSHRVIRFDLPGIGLGDPAGEVVTLEEDVEILEDLVDGLRLESFDFFGASQAVSVIIAYAVRHPERVGRLILFGGYANGTALAPDDYKDAFTQLVRANWGVASKAITEIWTAGTDAAVRDWFARMVRAAATPDSGARRFAECYRTDVRDLLGQVRAPTLVMHRRGDRAIRFELGREVAAGIPGARFLPLEGDAHLFYVGDSTAILAAILDFLGDRRRPPRQAAALSARERQVAVLIQHGLTNGEIAQRLGISERTAEAHAEHIRNKLGFRSRAQIAAWAAETLAETVGIRG